MRIIAGRFKGRRLKTPTWEALRPTSDKLRETLFNILAPRIVDARVLDGYAGTGAVGLEALSRGAAHVTFVEQHPRAVMLVEENLATCQVGGGYTIECGDLVDVLRRLSGDAPFDLILLDPPYDITNLRAALDRSAGRLTSDGLVVVERATRREPDVPDSLIRVRDVVSGDSTLTFLTRSAGVPAKQ